MTEWQWAMVVLGAGFGTYLLRAVPFAVRRSREFGRRHLRCLTYISFAVAAGIVSRSIFLSGGDLSFDTGTWIKAAAVAFAVIVYRFWPNTPVVLFTAVGAAMLLHQMVI